MADETKKPDAPTSGPRKQVVPILALDPNALAQLRKTEAKQEAMANGQPIEEEGGVLESLLKALKSYEKAQRMSFEVDPLAHNQSYHWLYRERVNLVPSPILKRLTGPQGDELVCQIVQARANILASFGRPRTSRFAIGFEFVEIAGRIPREDKELKAKLEKKLEVAKEFLWNCGSEAPEGYEYFRPNLSQAIKMMARDAVVQGQLACERMYVPDPETGKEKLVCFRPADAGTIFHIIPKRAKDQTKRIEAIRMLAELKNEKMDPKKYEKDEYRYVQVINGRPLQCFTEKEMVLYSFYPSTNVEFNGYPCTPIDMALNAIMTHINISMHNKLYFQNGRAAKGMMVIKSDDVDENIVQSIRNQFHQSINSVQNSFRTPIFGVGSQDDITWQQIDMAGRDGEFANLMDNNARCILSAFLMSPEELPGYSHLSRGTNSQALSESDNEFRLEAHRDVGLRPLLYDFQDFLNTHILPEIDKELIQYYRISLSGLDQDSPEKEATRIGQDQSLHMTYNEILERVEKDKIAAQIGGDVPLNPQFHQLVLGPFLTVGDILENYFKVEGASKDPRYAYIRDPFWIQFQQLMVSKAQMAMQNQMQNAQMQAQAQQMQAPPSEEQAPSGASPAQKAEVEKNNLRKREEWLADNYLFLEKTIKDNHNEISKAILARHKELVDSHLARWKKESKQAVEKLVSSLKDSE